MKYLVDANVLSEATRRDPVSEVVDWLEAHEAELVIDAIVLAELSIGVEGLPKGRKRKRLEAWFNLFGKSFWLTYYSVSVPKSPFCV